MPRVTPPGRFTRGRRSTPPGGAASRLPGGRSQHRPVPRTTSFGPLRVAYDDRVLQPRPWTILQSDWAVELAAALPPGPVLELCSGAGHIGQVVAHRTGRALWQVDGSDVACGYARSNAAWNGLDHLVRVAQATVDDRHDLAAAAPIRPVIAILDPPYLRTAECEQYPADPRSAIDGGPDGLDPARRLLAAVATLMSPGGAVLLQLRGRRQVDQLMADRPEDLVCTEVRSRDDDRAVALLVRSGRGGLGGPLAGR